MINFAKLWKVLRKVTIKPNFHFALLINADQVTWNLKIAGFFHDNFKAFQGGVQHVDSFTERHIRDFIQA